DAAKLWIIGNQLARRNLTELTRIMLAQKEEAIIAARAKERMLAGVNPPQNSAQGETRIEAAKRARVSHDTYAKGKVVLGKGTPELIAAVDNGDASIHAASAVATLPKDVQVAVVRDGKKAIVEKAKEVRAGHVDANGVSPHPGVLSL